MGNMYMFIINRVGTLASRGSTRLVAQTEKTIFSEDSKTTHPSIHPSRRRKSSPADVIRASPLVGISPLWKAAVLFLFSPFRSAKYDFPKTRESQARWVQGLGGAEFHRIVTYQSEEKAADREMTKWETREQRGKNKTFGAQITNDGDRV